MQSPIKVLKPFFKTLRYAYSSPSNLCAYHRPLLFHLIHSTLQSFLSNDHSALKGFGTPLPDHLAW